MKLVTFSINGRARVGELVGETIYAVAWQESMQQMLRRGTVPSRTYERFPLESVKLEAPLRPGKMLAIGLNYADHATEGGRPVPEEPIVFAKMTNAVIGNGDAITWRESITRQPDYEAELAVVIGRRASNVPAERAYDYVFGYTCGNDVSARDLQNGQWTRAKGLDTFCPLGPCLVTRDEISDPQNLVVRSVVNGELMQDGNTRDMVFKIPELIEYLTKHFTLEPGDVILTGTPAGVGFAKNPPVFLKDGDIVTISVEGIGELTNPCKLLAD